MQTKHIADQTQHAINPRPYASTNARADSNNPKQIYLKIFPRVVSPKSIYLRKIPPTSLRVTCISKIGKLAGFFVSILIFGETLRRKIFRYTCFGLLGLDRAFVETYGVAFIACCVLVRDIFFGFQLLGKFVF